jgi:phospholipid/cholesterol/gamma-HCH transport system substrate-binding protein
MKREVRVGLFLVGAFVIMAVTVFFLGNLSRAFSKKGDILYASFESVAGLDRRAVVRVSGVRVGYVEDIFLEGTRPTVRMRLSQALAVPEDSKVTLASFGMLGEKYVEILPGKSERRCPPGGRLEAVASVSLDRLGLLLLSIGNEVKDVGKSLKDIMNQGNMDKVQATLNNLASLSANLDRFFQDNGPALGQGLRETAQAAKDVGQSIQDVSKDLKGLVDDNRGLVKSNLEKAQDLIHRVEDSVRRLNETLDKLNKGQGTAGRLLQDPALYDEARQAVESVQKTAGQIGSLKAAISAQSEYYGRSGLYKSGLGFSLLFGQQNRLQAGIIRDPWRDAFTYSLQVGRRFGAFAPRAGVMESDFGLGLDFEPLPRRLQLSLDTFAFNRDSGPRFRLSSRIFPVGPLYLVLGVDDFSLSAKREFYFGLGVESR